MHVIDVFKARHQFAREVFYDDLWTDYSDDQLRTPVHESMNSLIWVLWHVARIEDVGVTRFVTGEEQVLHRGAWNQKMNLDAISFGYGIGREGMLQMSQQIDIGAFRTYWQAVQNYTLTVVDTLSIERLDETLSRDEVQQVLFQEKVAPKMRDLIPLYTGWTRLEALFHFSVTHYFWHGGEVRTIEGMLNHKT